MKLAEEDRMATVVTEPPVTAAPVPRWVNVVAHVVPLTTLPSGLYRLAIGLGVPVGFSGELAEVYRAPGWFITPYVVGLSLLSEGLALLTLGLVKPWGEVVPRWVPGLGGRAIPTAVAAATAGLGAVAVTWIMFTSVLRWGIFAGSDPDVPHGIARLVMDASYAPLLAWGPLLAIVTVAYVVRRRGQPAARTRPVS
jgi:hypothetical protein